MRKEMIERNVFEVGDVLDMSAVNSRLHSKKTLNKAERGVVVFSQKLLNGDFTYRVLTSICTITKMTAEEAKNAKAIGFIDLESVFQGGESNEDQNLKNEVEEMK